MGRPRARRHGGRQATVLSGSAVHGPILCEPSPSPLAHIPLPMPGLRLSLRAAGSPLLVPARLYELSAFALQDTRRPVGPKIRSAVLCQPSGAAPAGTDPAAAPLMPPPSRPLPSLRVELEAAAFSFSSSSRISWQPAGEGFDYSIQHTHATSLRLGAAMIRCRAKRVRHASCLLCCTTASRLTDRSVLRRGGGGGSGGSFSAAPATALASAATVAAASMRSAAANSRRSLRTSASRRCSACRF